MTDPIAPVTIVKGAEISGIRMQVAEDASLKKLWLRDAWYQVGWSEDVTMSAPLARTVLDEPLLVFRNVEGRVAALLDRCPHRFAPLSAGKIENGTVTCGYHGLAFDTAGACVRNPHGAISAHMRVKSYPMVEKHRALWVFMGEPQRADTTQIPDLTFIDKTPNSARITAYMPTQCNYQLLTDNILDLSHADYLHPLTLGGMMTAAKARTWEEGDQLVVEWNAISCDPPPAFRASVPSPLQADIWIEVRWTAPAVMVLTSTAKHTGVPRNEQDESRVLHNITPETAFTSHYFICSTRQFLVNDVEFNDFLRTTLLRAFREEDKPMLELQQARIGTADFWSLEPILLRVDAAAVRARRILERLIANEA